VETESRVNVRRHAFESRPPLSPLLEVRIIADDGRQLLTLALDHTDRELEVGREPPGRRTPP
jgi:hypothetical protein